MLGGNKNSVSNGEYTLMTSKVCAFIEDLILNFKRANDCSSMLEHFKPDAARMPIKGTLLFD